MVKLIANRSMQYAGRRLRAGDVFEARPRDARVLTLLQRADAYVEPRGRGRRKSAEPQDQTAAPAGVTDGLREAGDDTQADATEAATTGEAGVYQRRDMRAED